MIDRNALKKVFEDKVVEGKLVRGKFQELNKPRKINFCFKIVKETEENQLKETKPKYITRMIEKNILTKDEKFSPNEEVTREQLDQFVMKKFGNLNKPNTNYLFCDEYWKKMESIQKSKIDPKYQEKILLIRAEEKDREKRQKQTQPLKNDKKNTVNEKVNKKLSIAEKKLNEKKKKEQEIIENEKNKKTKKFV